jgi:integrase
MPRLESCRAVRWFWRNEGHPGLNGKVKSVNLEECIAKKYHAKALQILAEVHKKNPDTGLLVKPFDPCGIARRVFKPTAEALGLPAFTWRSFRRSAATAMHNAGVPLKVQQKIFGHTDADMALLYTESDTKEGRRAIERLDSLLFPNVPKFSVSGRPN